MPHLQPIFSLGCMSERERSHSAANPRESVHKTNRRLSTSMFLHIIFSTAFSPFFFFFCPQTNECLNSKYVHGFASVHAPMPDGKKNVKKEILFLEGIQFNIPKPGERRFSLFCSCNKILIQSVMQDEDDGEKSTRRGKRSIRGF